MLLGSTALSVTAALFAILFFLVVGFCFKVSRNHYWKARNVPSVSPFSFLQLLTGKYRKKAFYEYDIDYIKEFGKVFGAYIGLSPILIVSDPEILRRILVKDFHIFSDRRVFESGNNVIRSFMTSLKGDDWKRVRSVVTPAFSTGKLKKMIRQMEGCAVPTTQHFLRAAESGNPEECKRIFGAFTLDIIASAAFGTKLDSASDPDNIFVQHAKSIFINEFPWRILLTIMLPRVAKLFGVQPFAGNSIQFFTDLTNAVAEKRSKTKEDHGDFLQAMLDAQKNSGNEVEEEEEEEEKEEEISEATKVATDEEEHSLFKQYTKNKHITMDEFVAQCVLFFLAGYDTTATTLSMTVYYLALNPKCQEEIIKEVDAIWKKYPELDSDALHETKYLDAAISETLRMAPPATRAERKGYEDYHLEELGITLPKGMYIQIPLYGMHYNPEFFPEPETYQPERFLPENKHLIQPYTYLPFGAGPRNCLGMRFALMEIKICLLHVFRAVTFERCPETKVPVETYKGSGLLQPKAITLKVNKRHT